MDNRCPFPCEVDVNLVSFLCDNSPMSDGDYIHGVALLFAYSS
jgi:hypothetical protein